MLASAAPSPLPASQAAARRPFGSCVRLAACDHSATFGSISLLKLAGSKEGAAAGGGIGYSQHAGVVIVCDGTDAAAKRIERVLWNDPATGVMRHADAGYDKAIEVARDKGLNLPMLDRGAASQ